MLLMRECRCLAGCADGDEAVDAALDLALDQGHEGVLVDGAVAEWSDERRKDASEERFGHEESKRP
jgi:nicotinamidase-related amidase